MNSCSEFYSSLLLFVSFYPLSSFITTQNYFIPLNHSLTHSFNSIDPQVIRSIERRRQQWDSRMQREALRREESRAARLLKSTGVKTATDRMLERNAQQEDAKRKQREERARAEADAKERSRARKAAADHKIKTASVPLASRNMTNAAQKRLEATRRRTEAEELSRLKEEKQQRARDKRLKDMSYVMSGVIKERERKCMCAVHIHPVHNANACPCLCMFMCMHMDGPVFPLHIMIRTLSLLLKTPSHQLRIQLNPTQSNSIQLNPT
jgi:hypothetical protein